MKKLKNLIFVFIVMMFVSIINADAAGVSVKSVKLVDSNGSTSELSAPVPNGLDIKFDLSFSNVGDTATYEVVLNNTTNKEYEINTDKQFSRSNYISYSYELKDKTNRVKAKSEVTLYITIRYENSVPTSDLVDGKYVENNIMGINLLNEDNPSTFNNALFIILMLFMLLMATLIFKYTKNKGLFIVMVFLLLVPITVFALEKLKLTVSTKITIDEKYMVYYEVDGLIPKSQLNKQDYVYDECEDIWVMDGDNHEEYVYCDDLLRKDRNIYKPGDRVTVLDNILYYDVDGDDCTEDSSGIIKCPSSSLDTHTMSCMLFGCGIAKIKASMNDKSFICTEEEFNNMNFEETRYNTWEDDYGTVSFHTPNSFTMPRHNVYISVDLDCR